MITFWKRDVDTYGLSLSNKTSEANRISKLLKNYYDVKICKEDEPVFYFHKAFLLPIQRILKMTLKSEN